MSMHKGVLVNTNAPSSRPAKSDYLLRHSLMGCESHRQMLATALGILAGELSMNAARNPGRLLMR